KTVLAGVRYELPLDQLAESLVSNADYYWTDDATKGDGLVLDSYDLTNMRADLHGVGGSAVDLGLFIRNLFDDEYLVAHGPSTGRLGFETGIYGAPRMWGLEARYSF